MKRLCGIFAMILILTFNAVGVFANDIKVMLDGEYVDITPPVIVDGRSLLPIRDIVDLLGGDVVWDDATRQVTVSKGDTNIVLTVDSTDAYINGSITELDVPAKIINDSTMIPLRFVATALNLNIDFIDNTIIIATAQTDAAITPAPPATATTATTTTATTTATAPLVPVELPEPITLPVIADNPHGKFYVFWGHTGYKIHITPQCPTIKNGALWGPIETAEANGRTEGWCGRCSGSWTTERFLETGNPNISAD